MIRRRISVACLRAVAAVGAVALPLSAAPPAHAAGGLRLLRAVRLSSRLQELTFVTPAVSGPTGVRVLLPAGYAQQHRRRYPVLYLLHGAIDNYKSWTAKGDAEQLTSRYPLIVVMPDTGPSGGYTNWWNDGRGGPPEWETYHIDQLLPWIDAHFRTRAARSERAIAGISMGGFGALSYAARHPDLFAAAASFSGALDTNNPLDIAVTGPAVFGPRATQEVRWRAHDPWDLAANLRSVDLAIRTGNGQTGGPFGGGDVVEFAVHQMSVSFHNRLVALGIPSVWDDYGPGGHLWPYWQRDLRETLPWLMGAFNHPAAPPSKFSYAAVEPRYSVYGWSVALRRRALEFSTLGVVSRRSFSLTGSGSASVISARLFRPGRVLNALVRDARGRRSVRVVADRSGRIALALSLGPSNPFQEYTPQAAKAPRRSIRAAVQLTPVG